MRRQIAEPFDTTVLVFGIGGDAHSKFHTGRVRQPAGKPIAAMFKFGVAANSAPSSAFQCYPGATVARICASMVMLL